MIYLFHASGSCKDCHCYVQPSLSVLSELYVEPFTIFQQLGLERELIKVQGNLEAEMNMRNQANSAKADMECKLLQYCQCFICKILDHGFKARHCTIM